MKKRNLPFCKWTLLSIKSYKSETSHGGASPAFWKNTSDEEVVNLKKQTQSEFEDHFGICFEEESRVITFSLTDTKTMDEINYAYEKGENLITMVKKI